MRRVFLLAFLLVLAIGAIAPVEVAAADGAESSESLTSFSETLDEDAMYYPDGYNGSVTRGDYRNNMDTLSGWFYIGGVSSLTESSEMVTVNGTATGGSGSKETFGVNEPAYSTVHDDFHIVFQIRCNVTVGMTFYVWMATGDNGIPALNGYREFTLTTPDTWYTQVLNVSDGANPVESYLWSMSTDGNVEFSLDIRLLVEVVRWNSYSGYFEDFAGVNDWTTSDCSITTDGDVATITENGAGSTGRAYASFTSTDYFEYYYEFRIELMTATTANLEFWDGAAYNTLKTFTALGTYKGIISDADAATMQRIGFLVGSEGGNVKPDYLRVGPATEMGWQHDGSTTAGVTGEVDCTVTTDGDKLNVTGTGETDGYFYIKTDTTATMARIEEDYYQFAEISISAVNNADADATVGLPRIYTDGGTAYFPCVWFTEAGIYRMNIKVSASTDVYYFRMYVDAGDWYTIDYIKLYSIANFTYQPGNDDINSYYYVESGVLKRTSPTSHSSSLLYDPTMSMNTGTYPVWNITTDYDISDSGSQLCFRPYLPSGLREYIVDETRGDFLISTTMTRFSFYMYYTGSISAIKFIEDGTAPDADIVVSPNPPQDDEQITLSSIVFDDVEVWKVWYNAISYPTGFSDVDYEATEGQENYWSYSFSSLIAGDYCFKVIANDGANNNTITQSNRDYATIRFTVREAQITITTYTFFGASSDFTYMQYSGHISHDCTYNISEWSTMWAKNETHTGSVTEGMFNIAWDKIVVDDAEANFTIVFVSGTLSLTIEGYYGTAYKLLRITEIEVMNMEESLALTNITITFYTNKDVDWYVYDRDADDAVLSSGSSVEGSDDLYFLKNRIPYAHYYAVKWTDGVTNIWYNSSYWTYRQNIDAIDPAGVDWGAKDQRRTIEFWVTVSGIIGVFSLIVLGAMYYGFSEKLKALQLPHYRTQEREK